MSYKAICHSVGLLNDEIFERYDMGHPVTVPAHGRPDFRIDSLDPLEVTTYNRLLNRAPFVAGTLALRGLLVMPHPDGDGAAVYLGLERGRDIYGFSLTSNTPSQQIMDRLAVGLGRPNLTFDIK